MKLAMAAVEYKFKDTDVALLTISASGQVFGLTMAVVAQGDGASNRDGRRMTIKSIWMRAHLQIDQLAAAPTIATNHEHCRIFLILDKQCNGASPSYLEFAQSTGYDSFRNLENSQRFKILWQRQYAFAPITATDDGTTIVWTFNTHDLDIYTKVNIPIEYEITTTSGAVSTMKSNNLLLIAISEKGIARINGNVRIRFVG